MLRFAKKILVTRSRIHFKGLKRIKDILMILFRTTKMNETVYFGCDHLWVQLTSPPHVVKFKLSTFGN